MKTPLSFLAAFGALWLAGCVPQPPASKEPARAAASQPPVAAEQQAVVSPGTIPPTATPVKIALLIPLSGESVTVGNAMLDAASMALYDGYLAAPAEQIRSQIILLPKDAGNTPTDAVRVTQQAIEQGADFIIGPLFSQSVSQVAPLTRAHKINMLTFSNTRSVAGDGVYVFGFLPEQQVMRMAEYAYLHKYQRVAVLAPNDSYGEKVKDTLTAAYAQKGGRVAPGELYAPSAANIDAAVSRVAAAYNNTPAERRFQAIFIADGGYQLKNIIASLKKTNIDLKKIKLLGTGLWDDPEIAKISDMQGAWFPSSPPAYYENFEKRFISTYGYKPPRLASMAYDAVNLVARLAISSENGGLNAQTLTNPAGFISPANGLVRLLPDGTNERRLDVMEITEGGFKVIDVAPKTFDVLGKRP
jgi:branched-chain amino acid transport system substrate-binding protein